MWTGVNSHRAVVTLAAGEPRTLTIGDWTVEVPSVVPYPDGHHNARGRGARVILLALLAGWRKIGPFVVHSERVEFAVERTDAIKLTNHVTTGGA
jgi:hypothetical protein